jgi:hypothetical protein
VQQHGPAVTPPAAPWRSGTALQRQRQLPPRRSSTMTEWQCRRPSLPHSSSTALQRCHQVSPAMPLRVTQGIRAPGGHRRQAGCTAPRQCRLYG